MDGTDLVYPDEVDPSERAKPRPPPHSNHRKHAESALSRNRMETSRVYDDPASEQNNIVNTAASNEVRSFIIGDKSQKFDDHCHSSHSLPSYSLFFPIECSSQVTAFAKGS
ncbi:unnamed protein product [Anisakis simplex]|uniref:Uncharacterized protein n=1 Tax=Anisakis simplex TaxID=6269 RepID=A0A0M3JG05_ANISI|nr:unnamed protein product [Anisakis simplex]